MIRISSMALVLAALSVLIIAGCSSSDDKCGNGNIDNGEQCDGVNLGGQTCIGLGFSSGDLVCADCHVDTSACIKEECGNDHIEGSEQCDGETFGSRSCESLGFETGELNCTAQCKLDTSGCSGGDPCGNGFIDADEECDKNQLGEATCESLGFTGGGILRCDNEFCEFDTDGCFEISCTDDALEPNDSANLATPVELDYSHADLVACDEGRNDWFKMTLEPRHLYEFQIDFSVSQGELDLFLYWETNTDYLWAKAISSTDNEFMRYAFAEGEARTFLLEVNLWIDPDDSEFPRGPITYDLSISDKGTPECVLDADCNDAAKVCLDYTCQPMQPGDKCTNAIVIDQLPFVDQDVDIAVHTPQFQFDTRTDCAPYGSGGKDVIYRLALEAGQTLAVSAQGSPDLDVAVFITDGCTESPVSSDLCLVGDDTYGKGEAESFTFTAENTGTYYVMVDHWDHLGPFSGTFDLNLALTP